MPTADREQTSAADIESKGEKEVDNDDQLQYPSTKNALVVMIAIYLATFLVALNRTIIATAIPRISDEFKSLDDIGWYASAYLIANCATQLIFGKIYTFYSPKWVYLGAIILFEIGSALCGAAPNSTAFIFGRAIAGMGSSAIFSGSIAIMVLIIPLRKRPLFMGFFGAIFGIASVVAPLLGGAFTDKVSWRWCFYLNLPLGGVTLLVVLLILKVPESKNNIKDEKANAPLKEKLLHLDPLGTLCFLPGMICLLLALQWGGTVYSWGSARIVVLLVLFVVLIGLFLAIQVLKKEGTTLPTRIMLQRSILAGVWSSICNGGSMLLMAYYLPIWFQAIKGVDAVQSGIMTIPFVLSLVVGTIMGGGIVNRTGYYTPPMIVSCVLSSIGAGLITTFKTDTGHAKWIGYQVLFGFGFGLGMQQPSMAAQTALAKKDVPVGASLMFFSQSLGGAIFVSAGQNIFANRLESGLAKVPGIDASVIVEVGATALRSIVRGPENLRQVLQEYNTALVDSYRLALILSCVTIVGALSMEWRSIKEKEKV
ncbi:hypothetical protein FQN50_004674 [Emmonsiellopsis sp. PD_5]|nr:hypothetical protein FQN50_004674 [Emmonsiellopsis sp. PD_5]